MNRVERVAVAGAFSLVLAISAWLAFALPYGPDEASHMTMVRHHAHHLELTGPEDLRVGGMRGHAYNLFSPLPYAPYVPFQWLQEQAGDFDAAAKPEYFFVRLANLPIAAAQLAVTMALARRLLRRASTLQVVGVALAVNLLPQLRYVHAYVNTDGSTILAATVASAVLLRVLQRKLLTLGDAAIVGLTAGVAAHLRYNAFLVSGALLVVFAVRALRQRDSWRARLRLVGVTVALPVLLAGSFHLYVYDELQNGHVLASADNEQLTDSTFEGRIEQAPPLTNLLKQRARHAGDVWMGAWTWVANYVELRGPPLAALAVLCVLGLVGLLLPGGLLTRSGRAAGLLAAVLVLATWALMAAQALVSQQGRFLLPAGVAALTAVVAGSAVLVARPLARVLPRADAVLVTAAGWGALLLALDAWVLVRVIGA